MGEMKPSKGVRFSGWLLIVFGFVQLLLVPSAFRDFSFLQAPALWAAAAYLAAYHILLIIAAFNSFGLKKWSRGLLIVLLLVGFVDKAIFIPLRARSVEQVRSDPRQREALLAEYRRMFSRERPAVEMPDDQVLMERVMADLRAAHRTLETFWVIFYLALLFFYSHPNVRAQFQGRRADEVTLI